MSEETPQPRPPRGEYPTRASLRGRAPAPATKPIDLSKLSEAERDASQTSAEKSAAAAGAIPGRPVIGRPATGRAAAGRVTGGRAAGGRAAGGRAAAGSSSFEAASSTSLFEPIAVFDASNASGSLVRSGTATNPAGIPAAPSSTRGGSRRAGPDSDLDEPAHPQRKLPIAVVALVALVGAILAGAGVLQGTVFKPPTTIIASLPTAPTQPVVVTEPGMMALDGPRFQVTANSSPDAPVFLGIGRASDVQAYLAKVARLSLNGEDGAGVLTSRPAGTEASLPDPGAADVWVVSVRGRGTASLNWPDVGGGQWVLVAATDGSDPAPAKLTFTWSGATPASSGSALIAIGAVLLVSGLVLLLMLVSRARMERNA